MICCELRPDSSLSGPVDKEPGSLARPCPDENFGFSHLDLIPEGETQFFGQQEMEQIGVLRSHTWISAAFCTEASCIQVALHIPCGFHISPGFLSSSATAVMPWALAITAAGPCHVAPAWISAPTQHLSFCLQLPLRIPHRGSTCSAPFSSSPPFAVPKTCIGGSGARTASSSKRGLLCPILDENPDSSPYSALFNWATQAVVPFFCTLLLLLEGVLLRLLALGYATTIPRRCCHKRHLATTLPTVMVLAFDFSTTGRPALDWHVCRSHQGRRPGCKRLPVKRWPSICRLIVLLLGFNTMPVAVWAAPFPAGTTTEAVDLLQCPAQTPGPCLMSGRDLPTGQPPDPDKAAATSTTVADTESCPSSGQTQDSRELLAITLYTPYYKPVNLSRLICRKAGLIGVCEAIRSEDDRPCPHHDMIVAVRPQQFSGFLDLLSYPSVLDRYTQPRKAIMLDLSRVGGHYHAVVWPHTLSWHDIAEEIRTLLNVDLEEDDVCAWQGDFLQPVDKRHQLTFEHGDALVFMMQKYGPPTGHPAERIFRPGVTWTEPSHLFSQFDSKCQAIIDNSSNRPPFPVDPSFFREGTPREVAARVLRTSMADRTLFEVQCDPPLVLHGETCATIHVVVDEGPQDVDLSPAEQPMHYLLDLRPVGLMPKLLTTQGSLPDLPDILLAASLRFPSGLSGCLLGNKIVGNLQVLTVGVMQDLATVVFARPILTDRHRGPTAASAPPFRTAVSMTSSSVGDPPMADTGPYAGPHRFDRLTDDPTPEQWLHLDIDAESDEEIEPEDFLAGFHVLIPDYHAEVFQVQLRSPCTVASALDTVADTRDGDTAIHFDRLCPAHPQPDPSFACVLALPPWDAHRRVGVMDTRAIDGRLFAHTMPERLNRSSFLLHLEVPDSPGLQVYLRDALMDHTTWYDLQLGDTVTVLPADFRYMPGHSLSSMLQRSWGWANPCPTFGGVEGPIFCLLSEESRALLRVNLDTITTSAFFKQEAARLMRYELHKVTVCPTVPRLRNFAHRGNHCEAIVAATENISRIPVPPGRLLPRQYILFLDKRLLLLSVTWLTVPHGVLDYDKFLRSVQDLAPAGYSVSIQGGRLEHKGVRNFLHITHGEVLLCSPVKNLSDHPLCSDTDGYPSDAADECSSSSSDSDSPSPSTRKPGQSDTEAATAYDRRAPGATADTGPRGRSRSPHRTTTGQAPLHLSDRTQRTVVGLTLACQAAAVRAAMPVDPASDPFKSVDSAFLVHAGLLTLFLCLLVQSLRMLVLRFLQTQAATILLHGNRLETLPRQCKVLTEPEGQTAEERRHLRTLRALTRRLGGQWLPRLPFWVPGDPYLDPPMLEEDSDSDTPPSPHTIRFVVLKHDYTAEQVAATVQLPATQVEAEAALRQTRSPHLQRLFPILTPVRPQPLQGRAIYIASPLSNVGCYAVCLDTTAYDRRLFVAFVPAYFNRQILLDLANLPRGLDPVVWLAGENRALHDDDHVHATVGLLVAFLPAEPDRARFRTLGECLLDTEAWDYPLAFPEANQITAYCLAGRGQGRLFVPTPGRPTHYRAEIADCMGISVSAMRLFPAHPKPLDVAISGVTCRTVIGIGDYRFRAHCDDFHTVLLDCRPIQEGWQTYRVPVASLDVLRLLDRFRETTPPGFRPALLADTDHRGHLPALSGQIFTVVHLPIYAPQHVEEAPVPAGPASSDTPGTGNYETNPQQQPDFGDAGQDLYATEGHGFESYTTSTPADFRLHFLLHTPEYEPELISLTVRHPLLQQELIDAVILERDSYRQRLFPQVIPVTQQPALSVICLLALPMWAFEGVPVLIACLLPPMRTLAVVGPSILTPLDVLRLAGVDETVPAQVFVADTPWALRWEDRFQVRQGDLITILPAEHPQIPPILFDSLLRLQEGWSPVPTLFGPFPPAAWLVSDQSCSRVELGSGVDVPSHEIVAHRIGEAVHDLTLTPAVPPIHDHAHHGLPTSQTFVATGQLDQGQVPYILDSRAVLLRVLPAVATDGWVDVAVFCRAHAQRCPDTHFVRLIGGSAPTGHENHYRQVQPGQVLRIKYWQRHTSSNYPTHGPDSDPDDPPGDGPDDDSSYRHSDDARRSTVSASTGPDAGTGSTHRSRGPGPDTYGVSGSISMRECTWIRGRTHHAIPDGPPSFTPTTHAYSRRHALCEQLQSIRPYIFWTLGSLMGYILVLSLGAGFSLLYRAVRFFAVQPPQRRFAVCILLCYAWQRGTANAMTVPLHKLDADGPTCPSGQRLHDAVLAVPRPLRANCVLPRGPWPGTADIGATAPFLCHETPPVSLFEELGPMQTLLEESILQPSSQAYLLAATLLDTLVEYFHDCQATSRPHLERISLDTAIPLTPHQQQCIEILDLLPRPAPVLDPTDWLDLDLQRVLADAALKPDIRTLLSGIRTWNHQICQDTPEAIAIYTDGSADPGAAASPCSWAFTVWFQQQGKLEYYGSSSSTAVPPFTPYHAGERDDTAVTAELLALFWSIAWTLQYAPAYGVPVSFHYDAISVGQGVFGSTREVAYAADPGQRSLPRSVSILRQVLATKVLVSHHHVKGHSGHFANEFTDRIAHLARQHEDSYYCRCLPMWPCQLVSHPLAPWAWLQHKPQHDLPTAFALESEAHRLQLCPDCPQRAPQAGLHMYDDTTGLVVFDWVCITYNVLTLKDKPAQDRRNQDGEQPAGLKFLGRRAVLQRSLAELTPLFVGLQETRLQETATLPDSKYFIFQSGATAAGVGGCALWVSKEHPYAERQSVKYYFRQEHATATGFSHRHINVTFVAPFLRLFVMVAHGPSPANHTIEEVAAFWKARAQDLATRPQGMEYLILTDANSKVGSVQSSVVGPCNAEPESDAGTIFHTFLAEAGAFLPSTYPSLHEGPGETWFSSVNNAAHRLDYIGIPESWQHFALTSKVLTGFESLQLREDHRPVYLRATFSRILRQHAYHVRTRQAIRPATPEDHIAKAKQVSVLAGLPTAPWQRSVDDQYAVFVKEWTDAGRAMQPPPGRVLTQCFLSETALDLIDRRKALRLYLSREEHERNRRLLLIAFAGFLHLWRATSFSEVHRAAACTWLADIDHSIARAVALLRHFAQQVRRQVSIDRNVYLHSLTEQVQHASPKDSQALYRAVRKAFPAARSSRRSNLQPLPAVYNNDGQLATTPEEKQECWRQHFASQELGEVVSDETYLDKFRHRPVTDTPVFDLEVVPSLPEVEQIILGLKKHKAPGPDSITADLLRTAPTAASRQLYPILLKSTLMIQEPVEFRGGNLICLAKKAGAALQCKDFRSILLASVPAKVQHRHLRGKLLPLLQQHGHPTQAGAKAGVGIEAISLLARSFQVAHQKKHWPWAMTFYDWQAAFYRVVRETLVPAQQDDATFRALLHRIGIPPASLEELANQLHRLAALPAMGASEHLVRLTQDLFHATWFRMDYAWSGADLHLQRNPPRGSSSRYSLLTLLCSISQVG